MKTTKTSLPMAMFLVAVSMVQGCRNARDEFLWSLGSVLFLIYGIVLVAVLFLPVIHRWPPFIRLAAAVRKPAVILGVAMTLAGAGTIAVGLPRFFSEDFGPRKLLALLGCITFIAGLNLSLWARAPTPEAKAGFARVFMLSLSFGMGIAYVMMGAAAIIE